MINAVMGKFGYFLIKFFLQVSGARRMNRTFTHLYGFEWQIILCVKCKVRCCFSGEFVRHMTLVPRIIYDWVKPKHTESYSVGSFKKAFEEVVGS